MKPHEIRALSFASADDAEKLAPLWFAPPDAVLWRQISAMTRAFVQVEAQGFDLLEL